MDQPATSDARSELIKRTITAVTLWVVFSVIVGILPIVLGYVGMESRGLEVTVADVVSRGEMALICVGLASGSLGALIATGRDALLWKVIAGGMSFVIAAFAASYSADLSAHQLERDIALKGELKILTDANTTDSERKKAIADLTEIVQQPSTNKDTILRYSIILLIGTIISGASCVILAEVDS
ncbi:hypothetical protein [Candidatus Entotheonella palauensis]|uniref:hypothetical protein n=1 Tax=Candidatus Entotheonella palauensis TaxID=93172 RepID=UPI000B7D553E|nr:hypothetical protein [Candidatus Entotheonella palauensis]